ncbi:MAG: FAD-binding oxidoreductase, partial [Bacteroidota bacterium]
MSVWRYSHFILAVSSFLFLLLASITGAILSLEPVGIAMSSEAFPDKSDLSVAALATNVSGEFEEVFSIQTDHYHRVRVDGIVGDKIGVFYINPTSGKPLKEVS